MITDYGVPKKTAAIKPWATVKTPSVPKGSLNPIEEPKKLAVLAGRIHTVSGDVIEEVNRQAGLSALFQIDLYQPSRKRCTRDGPHLASASRQPGALAERDE